MSEINYSGNAGGKLLPDTWHDIRQPDDKFFEGNIIDVNVGKNYMGSAKIVEMTIFPYSKITDSLAYACCGGNKYVLDKILRCCYGEAIRNQSICCLVFQWSRRHLPTQMEMFFKYWNLAKEKHTIAYSDMPEVAQKELFTIPNA